MKEEDKTKEQPVQGAGEMGQRPTELDTLAMQRKQLEEALRESEEKYHHLFEELQEAAFVTDVETGLILDTNRQAEALLGKSRYEIVGTHYLELHSPEKADEIRQMFAEHVEKGCAADINLEVVKKDGKIVPVRLNASILTIRGKRVSLALFRDISERKQAEKALKESEGKYRSLVTNIPDVTWTTDSRGNTIFISPNVEIVYGYTPEEIYKEGERLWFERVHPDDVERVKEAYKALFEKGIMFNVEYRIERKDGKWIWLHDRAVATYEKDGIMYADGIFCDITERKQVEKALKESEEKYHTLYETIKDGIAGGPMNGRMLECNQTFADMLGYSKDELKNLTYQQLTPERWHQMEAKIVEEQILKRGYSDEYEKEYIRKDGTVFPISAKVWLVRDKDGKSVGMWGIVRDITERKKEEEVLKEYEKAVESSQELIAVLDRHYVYRLVNEAFLRYRCLNRDQVIGHTVAELVSEDVFETKIKPNFDRCLQGESVEYDMLHRYPEAGRRHMRVAYYPLKSDGEEITGVVAVIRNVTSEKKIELMRECIISLFQLLSKSINLKETMGGVTLLLKRYSGCEAVGIRLREGDDFPYFETDGFPEEFVRMENSLCTRALGGQIVRDDINNPVLECMCGNVICGHFDPAKPFFTEGGSFWTNSTTELLASTTEADRQAWTRDRCNDEGYESVALIPLQTEIETFGLLQLNDKSKGQFASSDISFLELVGEHLGTWLARKWGEKALQESERRYRLLAENAKDIIWTADMNLQVTYISPSVTPVLGYTIEEVMSQSMEEAMTPASVEAARKAFAEELAIEDMEQKDLARSRTMQLELKRKDGSTVWTEATLSFLRDDEGRAVGIVGVTRDITERKEMEEDRVKVSKLESVAILAGGIAHDFNNLLMAILGNVSVAKMYANPGDKIFDRLADATKASLQAKNLTNQLLIFSKGGEPIKKVASIGELIKDSVEFALRGSKARCELSIARDVYPVEVDEGQIGQVINNLILNADQAMPEGGVIEVRAENATVEPKQGLPLKDGKYVKISIKDQGIGIPEEHIPKVFDPYFTTKQKGSGLGLSTAYSIIKNHEGYICLESKTGVGTTVYVYFSASQKEILKKKDVKEETIVGEGKILVVDDEEMVRDVTGNMLKLIGYKVGFARDGAEVIEVYKKAKESRQPFDAIILDLTIPGAMGGTEAIKRLIEIDPQVKAIVSSGYSNDPVMANFSQYGFSGFLIKPYKIQELSEILQEVIMGKSE